VVFLRRAFGKLNDSLYIYRTEVSEKSAMDAEDVEVPVSPFCAYGSISLHVPTDFVSQPKALAGRFVFHVVVTSQCTARRLEGNRGTYV